MENGQYKSYLNACISSIYRQFAVRLRRTIQVCGVKLVYYLPEKIVLVHPYEEELTPLKHFKSSDGHWQSILLGHLAKYGL